MNKKRTIVYMIANPEDSEVVYSGIDFSEFIRYLPHAIDNLMLITGGSNVILTESRFERGLEVIEGSMLIEKLSYEELYRLGNFCFIDYSSRGKISNLHDEEIAELLYLGHMFKPLKSPFFDVLQNRFVYLAHDDGFYCKLYCRDSDDITSVLLGKITAEITPIKIEYSNIVDKMKHLSTSGILIDLEDTKDKGGYNELKIFTIGKYEDIDSILNNLQYIKQNAINVSKLLYSKNNCELTLVPCVI